MKLKIFSFFSGSGFLDLGFELNGYEIDLVNEYSLAFMNAYQYSRKHMGLSTPKYGYYNIDVNEFLGEKADELRGYLADAKKDNSLVGFIGGPPCPDYPEKRKIPKIPCKALNKGVSAKKPRNKNFGRGILTMQCVCATIFPSYLPVRAFIISSSSSQMPIGTSLVALLLSIFSNAARFISVSA